MISINILKSRLRSFLYLSLSLGGRERAVAAAAAAPAVSTRAYPNQDLSVVAIRICGKEVSSKDKEVWGRNPVHTHPCLHWLAQRPYWRNSTRTRTNTVVLVVLQSTMGLHKADTWPRNWMWPQGGETTNKKGRVAAKG